MNVRKLNAVLLGSLIVSLFSGIRYETGVFIVRPFDVGMVGMVCLLAGVVAVSKRFHLPLNDPILLVFALFSSYVIVNGLLIGNTSRSINILIQNIEFGLLSVLIADLARYPKYRAVFMKVLLWGLGLLAVGTALWYLSQGHVTRYKWRTTKQTFGLFAFLAFALFYWRRGQTYILLLAVTIILMILSGERKGWVAFVGALAAVLIGGSLAERKSLRSAFGQILRRGVLAGVLMTVLAYFLVDQFEYVRRQVESFTGIMEAMTALGGFNYEVAGSGSNRVRLFLLDFTLQSVPEHPFFGVGTGRFGEMLEQFALPGEKLAGSHSWYQRTVVETGLVGLGLFVLLWGLMLKRGLSLMRNATPGQRFAAIVGLGLTAYGATIALFTGGGGARNLIYLMMPAGLLVGMTDEQKRRRRTRGNASGRQTRARVPQ